MIFQCKCCGGSLRVEENASTGVCEYCGNEMTIPKVDDEKVMNLFNRANHLRMKSEFDNAMIVYENIVAEDKKNAEAYWGICLCKYGIEYVTDPKTEKMIPTCHRSSFTSILQDGDYINAVEYADSVAQSVYREEASQIAAIQKRLLEISEKEEPYDIFICYKESDERGKRTKDSVRAQDIYYELTKKKYRVFFSRISLEGKIGEEYEPYIFSALNSSKIMIVVGTSEKNMKTPWVKNEWSRFLSLINERKDKTLIPVYQDMDPYDMPEEFVHLQALDMGRLGFVQDLLEGISKLFPMVEKAAEEDKTTAKSKVSPLLQRAYIFLEDGDWEKADAYAERVLDQEPFCGEAYLIKLLVALQLPNAQSLADCEKSFDSLDEYKKIMKYGDSDLVQQIRGYHQMIFDRIRQRAEEERIRKKEAEQRRKEEEMRQKELEHRRLEVERAQREIKRKEKRKEEKEQREKIKNDYLQDYREKCERMDAKSSQLRRDIEKLSTECSKLQQQWKEKRLTINIKYFFINIISCFAFAAILLFIFMKTDSSSSMKPDEQSVVYMVSVVITAVCNLIFKYAAEDSNGYTLVTKICRLLNVGKGSGLERELYGKQSALRQKKAELEQLQRERQELGEERKRLYKNET